MKLSKLIADAQEILATHGDLDVLENYELFPIGSVSMMEVEEDDQFPHDYNMPKGTKVALVHISN